MAAENVSKADSHPTGKLGLLTIPNVLCVLRLLGSPVLIVLALADLPIACLWLFLFLLLTDWLDGKLAILLKQQTDFGARLDSFADATFYGCALLATGLLRWNLILQEWIWLAAALGSFLLTVTAGLIKFGRVPSYHTRMAKFSWGLVGIAFVSVFAGWGVWPLRVAVASVVLTNLEATAITLVLARPRLNVLTIYHALRGEGEKKSRARE